MVSNKVLRLAKRPSFQAHRRQHSLFFATSGLQRGFKTQHDQPRPLTTPTTTTRRQDSIPAKQTAGFGSLQLTWPHKGWKDDVVLEVVPSHRKPRTLGDKFAWGAIKICRWAMDFVTGMPPEPKMKSKDGGQTAATVYKPMSESQWVSHSHFPVSHFSLTPSMF